MSNFYKCIPRILLYEGGYVNDPADPGGETNFGISRRSFPNEDIKNMTKERATEIYKKQYWDACHLDLIIDPSKALQIFDFSITSGVVTSVELAQHIVGTPEDGKLGPITAKAINDNFYFVDMFIERRIDYYEAIVKKRPASLKWLSGWKARARKAIF
jgi:lysozyme family protein